MTPMPAEPMRIEEPTSAREAERVATFEGHRGLLRGIAYRMLGSMAIVRNPDKLGAARPARAACPEDA